MYDWSDCTDDILCKVCPPGGEHVQQKEAILNRTKSMFAGESYLLGLLHDGLSYSICAFVIPLSGGKQVLGLLSGSACRATSRLLECHGMTANKF